MDAYTLRVEIRQKQTASLVLLFLCLKPPSIRSQTYCKKKAFISFNHSLKIVSLKQDKSVSPVDWPLGP